MIRVMRWILVVPASVSGFVLSVYAGSVVVTMLDYYCHGYRVPLPLCPPRQAVVGLLVLFPALAAVLVVWFAYLAAPSHKRTVATVAYLVGALCACAIGLLTGLHAALLAALISGAIILLIVCTRERRVRDRGCKVADD